MANNNTNDVSNRSIVENEDKVTSNIKHVYVLLTESLLELEEPLLMKDEPRREVPIAEGFYGSSSICNDSFPNFTSDDFQTEERVSENSGLFTDKLSPQSNNNCRTNIPSSLNASAPDHSFMDSSDTDFISKLNFGGGSPPGGRGSGDGGDDDPNVDPVDSNLSLASVGGLEEHVNFLKQSVMYPMIHHQSLQSWGVDPPKGIMFHGPPGTGKTLLAKSLANELSRTMKKKVTFIYHKGGESFSKWFGESEEKLRGIFRVAVACKPSIIFFDEIDGLCPERGKASESSQAYAGVVTALLGLIDSVKRGEVFIIGATNRLDAVDPAIRRPGRFDKDLFFPLPDLEGRKQIVKIHTAKWPSDKPSNSQLETISHKSHGFTGADLEKLCRDTVIAAMQRCGNGPPKVTARDWSLAFCGMNQSCTNVFGSTVYISQPTIPLIKPLVQNISNEILEQLRPMLENDKNNCLVKNVSFNSMLIWDPNFESQQYLKQTLMKEVLNDPTISKRTIFMLNEESILKKMKDMRNTGTLIAATGQIIQQAIKSTKCCILYIPNIEYLNRLILNTLKEKCGSTFVLQLKQLPSKVTLIGTGAGPLEEVSPLVKDLFMGSDRIFFVRKPNADERLAFLHPIFEDLVENSPPAKRSKMNNKKSTKMQESFQEQLEKAVAISEGDQGDVLFKLYDALQATKEEYEEDSDELFNQFEDIISEYEENKLG